MTRGADFKRAVAQHCRFGRGSPPGPFQDDADPGDKFARAEGFGHVVITADLQAQHAVDLVVTGGKEEDRHVGGPADDAADLKAVNFRHVDVQHYQVRHLGSEGFQSLTPVPGQGDPHAGLAQGKADDFENVRIVVGNENVFCHAPLSHAEYLSLACFALEGNRCRRRARHRPHHSFASSKLKVFGASALAVRMYQSNRRVPSMIALSTAKSRRLPMTRA